MRTETKPFGSVDPHESLGSLLSDLRKHSTALIKGEIALIRTELRSKIDVFRKAAVITVSGFVLMLLAGMAFLFAGIFALSAYVGLAASALICGGFVGIAAAVLLSKGMGHFKRLGN
jgi:hypothetical protein